MKVIQSTLITILLLFISMSFNLHAHKNDKDVVKIDTKIFVIKTEAGKAIAQFHQALKSGDKVTARSLLADDVTIFEGGGVEKSADEYAQHHMLSDMKYLAEINTEVLEYQVKVIGDLAYAMSRTKSTGQYRGKNINSEGMETMVLQNKAGKWKIVHIHWSN
jgi:ketosteroid isomerase-like protein